MIKQLNMYFFGYEEISLHDIIWFYGFYLIVLPVIVVTMFIVLFV